MREKEERKKQHSGWLKERKKRKGKDRRLVTVERKKRKKIWRMCFREGGKEKEERKKGSWFVGERKEGRARNGLVLAGEKE